MCPIINRFTFAHVTGMQMFSPDLSLWSSLIPFHIHGQNSAFKVFSFTKKGMIEFAFTVAPLIAGAVNVFWAVHIFSCDVPRQLNDDWHHHVCLLPSPATHICTHHQIIHIQLNYFIYKMMINLQGTLCPPIDKQFNDIREVMERKVYYGYKWWIWS